MNMLENAWAWFSVAKNQKTLAFIGSGLVIAITGGWQGYLHFYKKPTEFNSTISVLGNGVANSGPMTATAINGGTATNILGNNNNVGVPPALFEKTVSALIQRLPPDLQSNDTVITGLTEAIKNLNTVGTEAQVKAALNTLAKGDTAQAKTLFAHAAEIGEGEAKKTAEAYRNLGALAYLDNTQEALTAYRRATELEPNDAVGWNYLGILLYRIGDLDEAITTFVKVLALGEAHHDKQKIAAAYNNLGSAYTTQGDFDKAVEYFQKALGMSEVLGTKEGMAQCYGNLGNINRIKGELDKAIEYYKKALELYEDFGSKEGVALVFGNLGVVYQNQGNLDKAMDYHQKSLALNEDLGSKEGMVTTYSNLGIIFKQQGHKEQAQKAYQKSIDFFKTLGNPTMVKQVQGWLDAL